MKDTQEIVKYCLYEAIKDSKEFIANYSDEIYSDNYVLIGDGSQLESIEIVNLLMILEEKISKKIGFNIDCFEIVLDNYNTELKIQDVLRILVEFIKENE